jgi:hypothetical protein
MKSIWWTIAMLVLAAISLVANKVLAQDQPHTDATAITSIIQSATTPQPIAYR